MPTQIYLALVWIVLILISIATKCICAGTWKGAPGATVKVVEVLTLGVLAITAISTWFQWTTLREQANTLREQVVILQQQTEAAKQSADAATAANKFGLRAYIVTTKIRYKFISDSHVSVTIDLYNPGRTPATGVSPSGVRLIILRELPEPLSCSPSTGQSSQTVIPSDGRFEAEITGFISKLEKEQLQYGNVFIYIYG